MPRSKVVLAAPSNALFDFDGNYKHEQARQAFLATFREALSLNSPASGQDVFFVCEGRRRLQDPRVEGILLPHAPDTFQNPDREIR